MFSDFLEFNEAQKNRITDSKKEGILQVEVPHWAAQIQIISYDNKNNQETTAGIIEENSQNTYISETILPHANYQIQVTLDGKTKSEWVMVPPGRVTFVPKQNWEDLKLTSSAPLEETEIRREWHTLPAEKWSRKITWQKYSNGNSRLFLFVRTLEPKKYRKFFDGLYLLNSDGAEITDFSKGAEHNSQQGWLAFNADLPEGGYILCLKRRDLRARYQPIYLCKNWETQVFLIAERFPQLNKMSVAMARKGVGFSHLEESAVAAEAVFKSFKYGTSHRQIAMSKQMQTLLRGKFENAWFGILAGYALQMAQEETSSESSRSSNQQDFPQKLQMALDFLKSEIPAHPDVRALLLENDKEAANSFLFPPMIWLGLERVKKNATKFVNTIQHGSLTYHVSQNTYSDSPWTAWHNLEGIPQFGRIKSKFVSNTQPTSENRVGLSRRSSSKTRFSVTDAFLHTAQTTTPIYDLNSLETSEPVAPAATAVAIENAALIKELDDIIKTGRIKMLPEKIFFNPAKTFNEILQVAPGEISVASGLPLSSVEYGLGKLRESEKSGFSKVSRNTATSKSAQTVLEYALRENEKKKRRTDSQSVTFSNESVSFYSPDLTVEELASKIRVEADRLCSAENQPTLNIAARLKTVAESLLSAAEYVVLTAQDGKILYFNSAFSYLLSENIESEKPDEAEMAHRVRQATWETSLNTAPIGSSNFVNPIAKDKSVWILKRIIIEDEASSQTRAYLNILNRQNKQEFTPRILSQIQEVSRKLSNRVLFLTYGKSNEESESLSEIENLTMQLENLINYKKTKTEAKTVMEEVIDGMMNAGLPDEVDLTQPDGTLYGAEFWGIARHELIAGAAMAFLSNRARDEVERILAPINAVGLDDVAGWADHIKQRITNPDSETTAFLGENRNRRHGTWHYVNIPHGADGYSRENYPQFTRDDDVVQMIKHSVLVLKGESDRFSELNALRWLAHLVGDIHQPIHVGCGYIDESSNPPRLVSDPEIITENNLEHDRGGNRLKLPISATLHSYWDSRLLRNTDDHIHDETEADETTEGAEANFDDDNTNVSPELKKRFIQKLVDRIKSNAPSESDAADETVSDVDGLPPEDWAAVWASNSVLIAREAYSSLRIIQKQGDNFKVEWEGREAYEARCQPLAQRQADAAAENLAALLNVIWSED